MSMKTHWLKLALVVGSLVGFGVGGVTAAHAQTSWPNQCWNYDGGSSCPICGGDCLHGIYLCCNNNTEAT
jgi:hypothetical protein